MCIYSDMMKDKSLHFMTYLSRSISEISLTVAEEGRPTKESEKAHQIEKCDCPIGYSGLSCEVGTPINTCMLTHRSAHMGRPYGAKY